MCDVMLRTARDVICSVILALIVQDSPTFSFNATSFWYEAESVTQLARDITTRSHAFINMLQSRYHVNHRPLESYGCSECGRRCYTASCESDGPI